LKSKNDEETVTISKVEWQKMQEAFTMFQSVSHKLGIPSSSESSKGSAQISTSNKRKEIDHTVSSSKAKKGAKIS